MAGIERVGVIGAGLMGNGIAHVAALSGLDVVLMDVQMPVMSGHEAARRLRERHGRESLPIVALTAGRTTMVPPDSPLPT